MKRDSEKLEELVGPAVKALKRVFENPDVADNEIASARLASSVIASWSRLKQTESSQEAVYFGMARVLATDSGQLERYLKATMPEVPLVRVLETRELTSGS